MNLKAQILLTLFWPLLIIPAIAVAIIWMVHPPRQFEKENINNSKNKN